MPSTPPCGIGGSQNPDGSCTGTYGPQAASEAGAHVYDGVSSSPVAGALVAAGATLAGLLFVRWVVGRVATFFDERRARIDAEKRAADELHKGYYRDLDVARYGQTVSDMEDAEDDAEDDAERDDLLEHEGGGARA